MEHIKAPLEILAYIVIVVACFAVAHIVGKEKTRGHTPPQEGTWDYIVSKFFKD